MIATLDNNVKKRARQQRAIQAASAALARAGWEGKGVEAAVIAQARDPLLDAQMQAQASLSGALAAQHVHLQHAGTCLDELVDFHSASNGLNGLEVDLSDLFSAFEALAADPANMGVRRRVVGSGREIAAKFNRASARLNCLQNDLNASIRKDVAEANQNLDAIADLNQQIMEARVSGVRPCVLGGQREQCLERLSGCVNIVVARRADGGVNVSIGGVPMVFGTWTPDRLATVQDKNGNARIKAKNCGTRLKPSGGSIAGKITARDGVVASLQNGLNKLASQLIARFNFTYGSDTALNYGNGRNLFAGTGASDIGVNKTVADDPSQLQTGSAPGLGTIGLSYVEALSHLGGTLSTVGEELASSQTVARMLANERESAHGVLIGEEAKDLKHYEQAFTACSKTHTKLTKLPPMQ
jgi:flagellar hook-associated protein 1 FlgK